MLLGISAWSRQTTEVQTEHQNGEETQLKRPTDVQKNWGCLVIKSSKTALNHKIGQ